MTEHTFDFSLAREALDTFERAREAGLSATYFPLGGDTAKFYLPVTHHVHVRGSRKEIERFLKDEKEA